jgi:hypothetical protein
MKSEYKKIYRNVLRGLARVTYHGPSLVYITYWPDSKGSLALEVMAETLFIGGDK